MLHRFSPRHLRLSVVSTLLFSLRILLCQAQTPAEVLLAKLVQTAQSSKSMRADVSLTWQTGGQPVKHQTGTILLMKPNFAVVKLAGDFPLRMLVSNGKDLFTFPDEANYTRVSIDQQGRALNEPWWGLPYRFFYTQSINPFGLKPDPSAKLTLLPNETIAGRRFRVLGVQGSQNMAYTEKLYIDSRNVLEHSVVDFGPGATFRADLSNLKIDPPISAKSFNFTPPASAKLKDSNPTNTMLALGDNAPDFTLPSLVGASVSLKSQVPGTKATLVNFWFVACPPCRAEFPEFEKLYEQLHAKGFNILAIDRYDSLPQIRQYVHEAGLTFPILLGGKDDDQSVFAQYRVADIFPSTYLLDAEGRIVYRAVGEDIDGLKAALAKLGIE